jgi:hypothetical protein
MRLRRIASTTCKSQCLRSNRIRDHIVFDDHDQTITMMRLISVDAKNARMRS